MTRFSNIVFALALLLPISGKALDAGVAWAVYFNGEVPYLEISIEIAPDAVTFRAVDSLHLRAGVNTLILLKQGDKIVNFQKYVLNSPVTFKPETLLDVKRFAVENGEYQLEITFEDIHDATNTDKFSAPVKVDFDAQKVHLSELQLLRNFRPDESADNPFVKNGFYLEPLPFNWYPPAATMMAFYAEVYNSDKAIGGDYMVRTVIEQEIGNGLTKLNSFGNQKKKPLGLDAVLLQLDISQFETGNYRLTVEVRGKTGEVLTTQTLQFQRSNPFLHPRADELTEEVLEKQFTQKLEEKDLRYSLRAIAMNVNNDEVEGLKTLLQGADLKAMRFFLFRYFIGQDPNNPETAYRRYMATARAADKQFYSGFGFGFESDRGRIYMKYGRPDDLITVEDDPGAPPYEIWVFYTLAKTKQRNVKFLFHNPTLAAGDFQLLHSTARGELNNPRWERDLYARNVNGDQFRGDNYHDATEMQSNFGRRARQYFDDF